MKTIILHNTRCSKSRAGVACLTENKVDFEIVNLIKNPLTKAQIKEILQKLGISAQALTRKGDALFKDHFKDKNLTEDDYLNLLAENPSLIQRPIVIRGDKAIIARPTELLEDFLKD